jgi:biotin carboxyl carrier protein
MEETELAKAREDLKWKKAHIDKLEKAQAAGTPATPTPTAPQPTEQPVTRPGKKQQVNLDDQSARAIAQAVRSAMGGTTLRVAFANPGSRGAAGNADPGPGTRGPMAMGPSQALGGY